MKIPNHITFTGVDERTDISELIEMSMMYPVEFGVLICDWSKDARHASLQTVDELFRAKKSLNLSAHLFGAVARSAAKKGFDLSTKNWDRKTLNIARFDRIQVNGAKLDDFKGKAFDDLNHENGLILQTRDCLFHDVTVSWLFDQSGGRGLVPSKVPHLATNFCGYSGGINPDNVIDYLKKIKGDGEFWIDIESGVRTNGWFDVRKCRQICESVYKR